MTVRRFSRLWMIPAAAAAFAAVLLMHMPLSQALAQRQSPLPEGDGTVEPEPESHVQADPEAEADPDEQGQIGRPGDTDLLLSSDRWREFAYGLSFRPPRDSRMVPVSSGDGVLRIQDESLESLILLSFRRTEEHSSVAELAQASIRHMIGQPQARVTDQRLLTLGDVPVALLYYQVPRQGRTPAIRAHAIVQIDPRTFALFQLDHDRNPELIDKVKRTFNAMIRTVRLASPSELDKQRESMMTAAESFRQSGLNMDRLREALIPEQYFRIRHGRNDVGYMRRETDPEAELMGIEGILMITEMRVAHSPLEMIDSRAEYFLSHDRQTEYWNVTQTFRPAEQAERRRLRDRGYRAPEGATTPTEHLMFNDQGLREMGIITVTRSVAGWNRGIEKRDPPVHNAWETPDRGYISHVERELLPRLLPRDEDLPHAFYNYHATSGRMVLRTERAQEHEEGGFTVYSRATLDQPEYEARFDADGNLIRRELPRDMVMKPASYDELSEMWPMPERGEQLTDPEDRPDTPETPDDAEHPERPAQQNR